MLLRSFTTNFAELYIKFILHTPKLLFLLYNILMGQTLKTSINAHTILKCTH